MPTYEIPPNAGKFKVAVARGGHFAAWNGKQGRGEVTIPVKTKKEAQAICDRINRGGHGGKIVVE